jgi:cation diffusion facilitator CzcD-associated flavoprotein CzcO
MESNDIKLVAVIGAGLSGISVLRRLSENKKFQLTCFEKNFKIGGTWIYTDQTSVNGFETTITTGMYTNLKY